MSFLTIMMDYLSTHSMAGQAFGGDWQHSKNCLFSHVKESSLENCEAGKERPWRRSLELKHWISDG